MKCPTCHVTLAPRQLEARLASRACGSCGGQWVDGSRYFRWLETRAGEADPPAPASPGVGTSDREDESPTPRLCQCCGRLLVRATVGHGVSFRLDRCAGCGGIWFEAGEWEALKSRGLHDDVHFVFSAAWQADVARAERQRQHEGMLIRKLGPADYAEAKRVRAWLDGHAHRAELYGLLLDGAQGMAAAAAGIQRPAYAPETSSRGRRA